MLISKTDVCIIGAGPSGVLATKHFKESNLNTLTFEMKPDVGGIWLTDTDFSEQRQAYKQLYKTEPNTVYKDLTANVCALFMQFKDFPVPDPKVVLSSEDFLDYIRRYCKHFDLYESIRFNRLVEKIRLTKNMDKEEISKYDLKREYRYFIQLKVTKKDNSFKEETEICFADYIIDGSGPYHTPFIPNLPTEDDSEIEQIHSNEYKSLDYLRPRLEGKRVAVIGGSASGKDLIKHICSGTKNQPPILIKSMDILIRGKALYYIIKKGLESEIMKDSKAQIHNTSITSINKKTVTLANKKEIPIDVLIWATGYCYNLSFLDPKDGIIEVDKKEGQGKFIYPLFRRTFSANEPSYAKLLVPFRGNSQIQIVFERQIQMIKSIFTGKKTLPSKEEMLKELHEEIERLRAKGYTTHDYYRMIDRERDTDNLMDSWFELSGLDKKDLKIEKMVDETRQIKDYQLNTGEYFYYPQERYFSSFEKQNFSSEHF